MGTRARGLHGRRWHATGEAVPVKCPSWITRLASERKRMACARKDFMTPPVVIPVLVTGEYEERHAGQTAAGVEQSWFPRIEAFKRIGLLDNPSDRAAKFISIISRHPERFRRISSIAWEPAR